LAETDPPCLECAPRCSQRAWAAPSSQSLSRVREHQRMGPPSRTARGCRAPQVCLCARDIDSVCSITTHAQLIATDGGLTWPSIMRGKWLKKRMRRLKRKRRRVRAKAR